MGRDDGRVVLVTGAAGGIGREVVRLLTDAGSTVLAADLPSQELESLSDRRCHPVALDVTDEEQWRQVSQRIVTDYGQLDSLINNAGTAVIKPMDEMSADEFRHILDINTVSVFLGTKALVEPLARSQGTVVNVSSVSGLVGQDSSTGYVASKGAVVSLTRALAVELAPHSIRVNCVCPGSTDTPLLDHHFASLPDGEEARSALARRHPIGRLLSPTEVAEVITFVASPSARGVTGSVWPVDGGLTATFDYGNSFAGGGRGE